MPFRHLVAALLLPLASLAVAVPYEISGDGLEVTDAATGLTWRRCAEGLQWNGSACAGDAQTFNFEKSRQHAQSEASASKKPWRVPTLKELFTIVDKTQPAPTIDPKAFPNTPAIQFWTSTLNPKENHRAYFVFFATGTSHEDVRLLPLHLRLVRDK